MKCLTANFSIVNYANGIHMRLQDEFQKNIYGKRIA